MEHEQAQNKLEIRINTEQTSSPQFQEPKWMKIIRVILEKNQENISNNNTRISTAI